MDGFSTLVLFKLHTRALLFTTGGTRANVVFCCTEVYWTSLRTLNYKYKIQPRQSIEREYIITRLEYSKKWTHHMSTFEFIRLTISTQEKEWTMVRHSSSTISWGKLCIGSSTILKVHSSAKQQEYITDATFKSLQLKSVKQTCTNLIDCATRKQGYGLLLIIMYPYSDISFNFIWYFGLVRSKCSAVPAYSKPL